MTWLACLFPTWGDVVAFLVLAAMAWTIVGFLFGDFDDEDVE